MELKNLPDTCDRCCKRIKPVIVLDGCDIAADCMDDDDAEIRLCVECIEEILEFAKEKMN